MVGASRDLKIIAAALAVIVVVLLAVGGVTEFLQTTINGLVAGSYLALGALGLTLIFGVLRLVNFAHGDYITLGAYLVLLGKAIGLPLVAACIVAIIATAVFSVAMEHGLWRPIRRRGAGGLQLLLVSIGVAFVLRYAIQLIAGANDRNFGLDTGHAVSLGSVHIGTVDLIVLVVGVVVLVACALVLRYTDLGRRQRALADNINLAETTGIDTARVVRVTWAIAGGLAALTGVMIAASTVLVTPYMGFTVIFSIFAAVIVGGIGSAWGAIVGGALIGIVQEWSTIVVAAELKAAVGFAILIAALVLRPEGIFGKLVAADRS